MLVLVARHNDGMFVVSLHKDMNPHPQFMLEYLMRDTALRHAELLCRLYDAECILAS